VIGAMWQLWMNALVLVLVLVVVILGLLILDRVLSRRDHDGGVE